MLRGLECLRGPGGPQKTENGSLIGASPSVDSGLATSSQKLVRDEETMKQTMTYNQ